MITQRAVSVRLKKEGIQHMTDFQDMSNAFACTRANCRAEVLEELINETDRPMFFESFLSSTVRYDSDEVHFFATPQCGNLTGSSEGPLFFLAACALSIIRWSVRTMERRSICRCCREQTPSGLVCDLGLSAYEALEHSDRVLDEELEGGGWKRNMDKREVLPTMKERGSASIWRERDKAPERELDTWADASRGTATIGRSCSAERERYALRDSQWADSGR